jgi:hypothetical protein
MTTLDSSAARDLLLSFGCELGRFEAIPLASAYFEASRPPLPVDAKPERWMIWRLP